MRHLAKAVVVFAVSMLVFWSYEYGWYKSAAEAASLHEEISKLKLEKADLEIAIIKQNTSISIAEARTDAAKEAKARAEKHAQDLGVYSKNRMDKLQATVEHATSCSAVLEQYWRLRP